MVAAKRKVDAMSFMDEGVKNLSKPMHSTPTDGKRDEEVKEMGWTPQKMRLFLI